jgi:hypothetical protein
MTQTQQDTTRILAGIVVVAVLAVAAYGFMTQPDTRSAGERLGDAVSNLDDGVDDAARELEPRTPAERLKDDYKDATDGSPE